jgi:hypothetical protein
MLDACSWRANDRLATNVYRGESIVEGEDLPWLNGGEATAELIKPRPHNPPTAAHIGRLFPCWFMSQLKHREVSLSARYRTLTLPF